MVYRPATLADVVPIDALHARSWQETYRGILPDHFLDTFPTILPPGIDQ